MVVLQGDTHGNIQLVKHLAKAINLALHFVPGLLPETLALGLFKRHGRSLLQRRHAAVTNTGMRRSHILDQMRRPDEISDSPARGIKRFTSRSHSERAFVQLRRQCGNAGEWHVEQAVIDLVRQDDEVVLGSERANSFELLAREDFSDRVMSGEQLGIGPSYVCIKYVAYGVLRT